jgi:O-antigen/teichoic acid export membrane protein
MKATGRTRQYFLNVFWSWLGVVTLVGTGIAVSPVLFRTLGDVQAGIWTLALSFVEYFWIIDIGFRPATVKLCAQMVAEGRRDRVNALVNTAICYTGLAGGLVFLLIRLNEERIGRLLGVTDPDFGFLLFAVGLSWSFGLVFNVLTAALEGLERFDLSNRNAILVMFLRGVGTLGLLWSGYGLRALGWNMLAAAFLGYALTGWQLYRVYPELRFHPGLVEKEMARHLFGYARQMAPALLAGRLQIALLPSLITSLGSVRLVAYFSNTQKVLDYMGEGIGRVGQVTMPRVTEWQTRGEPERIVALARYGNRYCLMLWLVAATFLAVYSEPLFRLWINEQFVRETRGLMPVLLVGYTLSYGQFLSAAILMGVARYQRYSLSFFLETALVLGGAMFLFPRYGLLGVAMAVSAGMAANRSLNLSWIFRDEFRVSWWRMMVSIHAVPLALGAVSVLGLTALRETLLPGTHLWELIAAGALNALFLAAMSLVAVLEPEHREMVVRETRRRCGLAVV